MALVERVADRLNRRPSTLFVTPPARLRHTLAMVARQCRAIKRWPRHAVMDVLLSVRKTCCCCGAQSTQPIYAGSACFSEAGAPLDGSAIAGRLNRGMQTCPECGYASPNLDAAPGRMSQGDIRIALASAPYRNALRQRRATDVRHACATRWLAYATAFESVLAPEQAGLAWTNAAIELEQARLHRLGSSEKDSHPDLEQAQAARRKAIGYLGQVFEAEFGSASGTTTLPGIRRALRRWWLGEKAFRPVRWSAADHLVTNTSCDMRFELACTLTDLLRRTGEFVAARTIALRTLHAGQVPGHLAATLSFQLRLCHEAATGSFHQRDLVDTVVALPVQPSVEHAAAEPMGSYLGSLAAA